MNYISVADDDLLNVASESQLATCDSFILRVLCRVRMLTKNYHDWWGLDFIHQHIVFVTFYEKVWKREENNANELKKKCEEFYIIQKLFIFKMKAFNLVQTEWKDMNEKWRMKFWWRFLTFFSALWGGRWTLFKCIKMPSRLKFMFILDPCCKSFSFFTLLCYISALFPLRSDVVEHKMNLGK